MKLLSWVFSFFIILIPAFSGLRAVSTENNNLFSIEKNNLDRLRFNGEYSLAIEGYRKAANAAKGAGTGYYRLAFLSSLSNCQLSTFQFRAAIQTMREGRQAAKELDDRETLAIFDSNMSSLFAQMDNLAEASSMAEEGFQYFDALSEKYRPLFLAELGTIRARNNHLDSAETVFQQAIDIAHGSANKDAEAWVWDALAYARLRAGKIPAAETAAQRGLQLREAPGASGIDSSYMNLGEIRAKQGNLTAALSLMAKAEEALHRPGSVTPQWRFYMRRGRIKLDAGELAPALGDLRMAVAFARDWRVDVIANDINRTCSEGSLAELYASLVEAGNRLYLASHDEGLIRETFEAAEENRAASLRALLPQGSDWRGRLPSGYYRLLVNLQAAIAADLQAPSGKARANLVELRSELEEMEANAGGPAARTESGALDRVRAMLNEDSALFTFDLGEADSWLWAVTKSGITLHQLPPETELGYKIHRFARKVEQHESGLGSESQQLYQVLFGSVPPAALGRKNWLLVLDGKLFDLPFPALSSSAGRFLIEDHSLRIFPSALMLKGSGYSRTFRPGFLGVGDPIYNRADSRAGKTVSPWSSFLLRVNDNRSPGFARLWGTAREIAVSEKTWNAPLSVLLTGKQASPEIFWRSIQAKPDIIHIATHVIELNTNQQSNWIALSLSREGKIQYITPEEIQAKIVSARLVVLSGCSSGKAEVRTATGLMGLTRAWIAAGAGSVLATRWPTIDDDGAFFESFYRNLRENSAFNPAEALRKASLEMLKSGTWRATPSFWAGYFLVGNS